MPSDRKSGVKKNGLDVWMWKYDGDLTTAPTMIIFNNGGGHAFSEMSSVDWVFQKKQTKR